MEDFTRVVGMWEFNQSGIFQEKNKQTKHHKKTHWEKKNTNYWSLTTFTAVVIKT